MSRPPPITISGGVNRERDKKGKMHFSETEYIIKDGVRHVKPYPHEFISFAKGRWVGLELISMLCKEFGSHPRSYWEAAISCGNVLVNDKSVTSDYVLRHSDRLLHRSHRHEPPITGEVKLLGETSDLLAVSKPASLPMHPCGSYRYNTLMFIMAKEPLTENQPRLNLVHRLDRVTSGVVIMAKTKEAANRVCNEIRSNKTKKVYLARVKGRFPSELSRLRNCTRDAVMCGIDILASTPDDDSEDNLLLDVDEPNDEPAIKKARPTEFVDEKSIQDKMVVLHANLLSLGNKIREIKERPRNSETTAELNKAVSEISAMQETMKTLSVRKKNAGRAENVDTRSQPAHNFEGVKVVTMTDITEIVASEDVGYYLDDSSGVIFLRCPVGVVSFREGIHACAVDGKQSVSTFRCLGYDEASDTTLVEVLFIYACSIVYENNI
jgi:23S rRNA-/tRNA-specific pseudouridylate synthase